MSKPIQQILIIGTVFPEPNSSAAGSRMMQLITALKNQQYKITFASAAADSEFMVNLANFDVEKATIKLNDSGFDEFVKTLNPDLVLFDRFITEEQFGWRVAENCPNAIKVLDTEDLHCLRSARQKAFKEKRDFYIDDLLKEDIAKREIASILRCDLSLIISSFEMRLLNEVFNIDEALLLYLPFLLPKIEVSEADNWLNFEDREHFITIGNFLHEPNYQAVIYLKNEIWPLIRKKLPEAQVHVYGAYPSAKVTQLNNPKEGFLVKGRALDAKEVMGKARVCLCPLVFGAGLKGKLIDAMQSGTPNVSTPIAVEGMREGLPWGGFVASNPKDFSDDAVKLYQNKNLWGKFQLNGIDIVNQLFDEEKGRQRFISSIKRLNQNLEEHRKSNFLGAMLQYHSAMGTKYLSKWIEEKNK
ncbi:glycosyltransferase [Pedobacter sp. SD-b]|uniref:Glycosyltransferase n=1 Tax=Pedobacter segetis TaxID=2793069 RepID=A0ABS1BHI6_9SPHI|nr:glycosyltransferase [Pedobacter segetis]MBK0382313.1 glycosyltransferase [Pedobacter segetis]